MREAPANRALHRKEVEARRELAELRTELAGVARAGISSLAGGFDSGRPGRLRKPGVGSLMGGTGAAWSLRDQWTMSGIRAYCQDAERNNALAGAMIDAAVDLDLMDGLVSKATTDDKEWNKTEDEAFERWASDASLCDAAGLSNLDRSLAGSDRAWYTDGDGGFLLVDDGGEGRFQWIEAERIRNPMGQVNSPQFNGGFEFVGGRPVKVHIAEWETTGTQPKLAVKGYPFDTFIFMPNPMDSAGGVVRTAPQLQAVVKRLEDLDSFDEATRTAAWIQACMAVFISLERPDLDAQNAFDAGDETVSSEGSTAASVVQRQETVAPAMIKRLGINEKASFLTPGQPGPEYDTYTLRQVSIIGARLGIPLHMALFEARGVNLASLRSVTTLAKIRSSRRTAGLTAAHQRVRKWFTARRIARGLTKMIDGWDRYETFGPPAPMMDPASQIAASGAAIAFGLTSRDREAMQCFGYDVETVDEERAADQERADELGIREVTVAGAPVGNESADPNNDPNADPNADPKTRTDPKAA